MVTRSRVIHPHDSRLLLAWDTFILLSLVYIALFTPFEAAFLAPRPCDFPVSFAIHRAVDMLLLVDVGLQFFVMVQVSKSEGAYWLRSRATISRHYLTHGFWVDVGSVVLTAACDVVAMAVSKSDEDDAARLATEAAALVGTVGRQ
eukprot:274853-Prymnesium_polylepis.1